MSRLASYQKELQEDLSSGELRFTKQQYPSGVKPAASYYSLQEEAEDGVGSAFDQLQVFSPSSSTSSSRSPDPPRISIRSPSCTQGEVEQQPQQVQEHHPAGLSREYQPKAFEEVIGHEIITRALSNAIRRKRISPLYLFQGPSGTGKTSAATIFAMLLNCTNCASSTAAASSVRPCWECTGCSHSLHTSHMCSRNKSSTHGSGIGGCGGFQKIRSFLNTISSPSKLISVFILDDDSLCSRGAPERSWPWEELLDIILEQEEQRSCSSVVFILVMEDASGLPKTVSSLCQKFSFSKLKDAQVMLKLSRIVSQEGMDISKDALRLVVRKAQGNMREAENLFDQLALLEVRITASIVQQLVGLVPHERLVHLLEAAISGRSTEAVRSTRDLIECGIEPRSLVSQLSSLVIEILAGIGLSSPPRLGLQVESPANSAALGNMHIEILKKALEVLIETEKQLMNSPFNHTTWITGVVLQIASFGSSSHILTSEKMLSDNSKFTQEKSDTETRLDLKQLSRPGPSNYIYNSELRQHQFINSTAENLNSNAANPNTNIKCIDMEELWHKILERINNKWLGEFLRCQTKIISLTVSQVNAIVHLMVKNSEEIPQDISDTLKVALGCPVTVNISREPAQEQTTQRNLLSHSPEPSRFGHHKPQVLDKAPGSLESTLFVKRSLSHGSGPNLESNIRCPVSQSRDVILRQRRHSRILSDQLGHGGRDSIFVDHNLDNSQKVQCLDTTSIGRATDRLLLIPAVPQTDASIEPYSQDLLFEEARNQRRQGERYSKLYREFLQAKQHPHDMPYRGLNHSWSCRERFCRGEKLVEEEDLATKRHVLKLVHPCKESSIINSISNNI